ncbi:unnamed protein product [Ectocarpus fasciculatus]
MEAHLRKITRCLGRAVAELERVSTSEKIANEARGQLDEEWMARFFAGIAVPAPFDAAQAVEAHACFGGQEKAGVEEEKDLRWTFLETKWLPLLQDLYRTVGVLDREESALQALEQKEEEEAEQAVAAAEARQTSGGEAEGGEGAAARKKKSQAAPPRPPKGLLSLRDYTVIHAALEVAVHWGLVPVLEAGVGVFEADKRPRSRAVKISRRVLHYWSAEKQYVTGDGPSPPRRPNASGDPSANRPTAQRAGCGGGDATTRGADPYAQLALCTEVVQGVVTSGQFMPMLMPLYLPDLLAARLQLVFGRTAVATVAATTTAGAAATATPASTLTVRDNDDDKRAAAAAVDGKPPPPIDTPAEGDGHRRSPPLEAVTNAGPRQVMGALRHLLSQGARAPPWLRQRAGRILSEIVLRPGGVQATLEVYLAGASGGDDEGEGMKACLRVAKLLATPPKRVASGVYVSRVAPQLAEMLHFDGQQRAIVTRVVAMIVGRLSESMPGDTRRLILLPLLRPLLLFWGPRAGQRQGAVSRSPAAAAAAAKGHPITTTRTSKPRGSASPPVARRRGSASATTGSAAAAGGKGSGGGGVQGDDIVSSEESLERCLEDLEKLLTAAPAPAALLGLLSGMGVTVPLFRLHCFCTTAKSRNLQSTKACLSALLPSSATAASDLVAGLLPVQRTGWGEGEKGARFSPGPTGGTVLHAAADAAPAAAGGGPAGGDLVDDNRGSSATATPPPAATATATADGSLLGMEAALEGLGLDPETLRLVGSAAAAAAGAGGGAGAGLVGALAGLKEAEGRARAAAELLEGLGEGSPVAGKVFDMLLRRYLSLRDGGGGSPVVSGVASAAAAAAVTDQSEPSTSAPSASAATAAEQHAVMASVVVLAERLGARVFGTGMQMLSCIRLVLEHEQPPVTAGAGRTGGGGGGGGDGYVDAAERVARMEAAEGDAAAAEGVFDLGSLGEEADGGGGDDNSDDTLCSVVLALLTTVLELGEEERKAEEEAELRAMLGPLKGLASGHRSVEVAEMSALLSASILSRGLSPEERREERERVERVGERAGGAGVGSKAEGGAEARAARMMSALDAAEEDLRSEAVPLRARGVVTLTR